MVSENKILLENVAINRGEINKKSAAAQFRSLFHSIACDRMVKYMICLQNTAWVLLETSSKTRFLKYIKFFQGEMVDRIENSVQNAVEYSQRARGNVEEARRLQKRARKMKVCIIIASIIIILILLVFFQAAVCHFTPIC